MKLETENVKETEASAELIRELMADDAKRGNWLVLMHDDDEPYRVNDEPYRVRPFYISYTVYA